MWMIFSLLAAALPIAAVFLHGRKNVRNPWLFSVGSFLCFAVVCMDELFTIRRRTFSGDFGGIEDTIGAVLLIVGFVAVATVLLNALMLGIYYAEDK